MPNRVRRLAWIPTLLAPGLLLPGAPAGAVPLSDVQAAIVADGSYVASAGDLTLTFTRVSESGGVDLSQVDLLLVDDPLEPGFDLVPLSAGALSAVDLELLDLQLEFTVASGLGITGAASELTASVGGLGMAMASVSELIVEEPGVDLGVAVGAPFASAALAQIRNLLTIDSKNLVLTSMEGSSVEVTRVAQRFAVVPEPASAGLLLAGLLGLAASRARSPRG